ncbi:MAG: HaeIII family restriction endonuclease [Bacillota bacterium]|nr:HaeIII family restriction endonuclease [Bacillota bacterium]
MSKQIKNGKAFEYACLDIISKKYKDSVVIIKEENKAYKTAEKYYNELESEHKSILKDGSKIGIDIVERLEPNLMSFLSTDKLILSIQTDAKGQTGDVRDVLINKNNKWEIGISSKHNHEAVKHSRLSPTIDFGKKWLNIECSDNYFNEINSVFNQLIKLKGIKWKETNINKSKIVYKPLLDAFKKEMMNLYEKYGEEVPKRLVKYLIGKHDFYKFILEVEKRFLKVNAYNISGALNRRTKNIKSEYNLPKINLPTKIYHFDFLENKDNTLELSCNNGWQISFRIHNASSKIETSMKFDVMLIGVPVDIPTFIGII